jgi:HNH endonuclease
LSGKIRAGYEAYIVSDAWQARRRRVLKRDKHQCQGCGATSGLHVHHRTYEHFTAEPQSDLVTVCQTCHQMIHDTQKLTGRDLATVTDEVLKVLARAERRSPQDEPERRYRGARPRDWRNEVRGSGTHWARHAKKRDERASARRANGLN